MNALLSILGAALTAALTLGPPLSAQVPEGWYVVSTFKGSSATGDWATKDKQIALYINSGWAFYVPKEGWLCYVQDEQKIVAYHSSAWSTGVSV